MASRCSPVAYSVDHDHGLDDTLSDATRTETCPQTPGNLTTEPENDRQSLIDEVTAQVIRQLRASRPDARPEPEAADAELVFVVCSFDPEMDPVFEAIAAAAAAVGLRAERVKDVQGDYRITEKILTLVRTARLIVADLSRDRPNVYFELGYARGLSKTVITILRTGATTHFDVRDWTYLEYIEGYAKLSLKK